MRNSVGFIYIYHTIGSARVLHKEPRSLLHSVVLHGGYVIQ